MKNFNKLKQAFLFLQSNLIIILQYFDNYCVFLYIITKTVIIEYKIDKLNRLLSLKPSRSVRTTGVSRSTTMITHF